MSNLQPVAPEDLNQSENTDATGQGYSPDTRWVDERLAHDAQRRRYKTYLFWASVCICALLYFSFFSLLILLFTHTVMLQMFLAHKHTLGLFLALLLVPSAILWGLVRAVFKVEVSQEKYAAALSEGIKLHPGL